MNLGARFFPFLLILLLLLFSSTAHAACLTSGKPVVGILERILERNRSGTLKYSYILSLDYKHCVRTPVKRKEQINGVTKLGLDIRNAKVRELNTLLGLRVSVRGLMRPVPRKDKRRDAFIYKAVVLGSFDPRNNRFHKWRFLKRRIARMRNGSNSEDESVYVTQDTTALDRLIRRTLRSYGEADRFADVRRQEALERGERPVRRKRSTRNKKRERQRQHRSSRRKPAIYPEVISFILDDFLQFPAMHPAEVVEFYKPKVHYNNRGIIPRENAVKEKFSRFRDWPNLSYNLVRRSVKIRPSRHQPGIYNVRFQYVVRVSNGQRTFRFRELADLLVDFDFGVVTIKSERTRSL